MLIIASSAREIDYAQLSFVYEESISINGKRQYPYLPENMQMIQAQQDFYSSIEQFFSEKSSQYAIWSLQGCYTAALRIEPYQEGYLIAGLETSPNARSKGCATTLLCEVLGFLSRNNIVNIYSHIDKNNYASRKVHERCGFSCIMDHAVFLDGSVSHRALTYCYKK